MRMWCNNAWNKVSVLAGVWDLWVLGGGGVEGVEGLVGVG